MRSLPWVAGKGAGAPSGIGRWVAGQLAGRGSDLYVEPFAGMCGVLLQRPQAREEIASDVDRRLLDWWVAVRDHPEDLTRRLAATPLRSREHLVEAHEIIQNPDADVVGRAAAVAVMCLSAWKMEQYRYVATQTAGWPDVMVLCDRLRRVSLWHCSAAETLDRLSGRSLKSSRRSLIYCDPPYPGTTNAYCEQFTDHDANDLSSLLVSLIDKGWDVALSTTPDTFHLLEERCSVLGFDAASFLGSNRKGKRRQEALLVSWKPQGDLWSSISVEQAAAAAA